MTMLQWVLFVSFVSVLVFYHLHILTMKTNVLSAKGEPESHGEKFPENQVEPLRNPLCHWVLLWVLFFSNMHETRS